jgi:hypothetical protein
MSDHHWDVVHASHRRAVDNVVVVVVVVVVVDDDDYVVVVESALCAMVVNERTKEVHSKREAPRTVPWGRVKW